MAEKNQSNVQELTKAIREMTKEWKGSAWVHGANSDLVALLAEIEDGRLWKLTPQYSRYLTFKEFLEREIPGIRYGSYNRWRALCTRYGREAFDEMGEKVLKMIENSTNPAQAFKLVERLFKDKRRKAKPATYEIEKALAEYRKPKS